MKTLFFLLTAIILAPLNHAAGPVRTVEVDSDNAKISDGARKREAESREAESRKALEICRNLPGYDQLLESFEIKSATIGLVNSMPKSLFVRLRSTKKKTIDAVRWWNPLSHEKPTLDWRDFLAAYAAAERAVAKHPWLAEQKDLGGERSLELELLGTGAGVIKDEFDYNYRPAWKHARMAGQPTYYLLGRRGNHSWIEYIFSDRDDRAFISHTSVADPGPRSELDRVNVSWHPRGKRGEIYSRYALVGNDGRLRIQTFVMDEQ